MIAAHDENTDNRSFYVFRYLFRHGADYLESFVSPDYSMTIVISIIQMKWCDNLGIP